MGKIAIVGMPAEAKELLEVRLRHDISGVDSYEDASTALLNLRPTDYELMVLGLMMPDGNNPAFSELVRHRQDYPKVCELYIKQVRAGNRNIPILVTEDDNGINEAFPGARDRVLKAGANAYIDIKEVNGYSGLAETIRKYLKTPVLST